MDWTLVYSILFQNGNADKTRRQGSYYQNAMPVPESICAVESGGGVGLIWS
jgi:hypothetical protein